MIKLIKDKFNSIFGEVETTEKFNLEFIDKIQPLDNLIYKEDYIKKGSGYETCIHIHDYPKNVKNHWLNAITDISLDNIIITTDVSTMDEYLVNEKLEKDIREKNDRASNSSAVIDRITERDNLDSSIDLAKKLNSSKILIKLVHIRIFMYANTLKELETEVTKFLNYLKGKQFKGGIFLNELEYEYKSIYNDYTTQAESFFNKRNGKEINSDVLGVGVDFHATSLSDENGTYFGDITTGGTVVFNPFLKNDYRKSYNGLLLGKMGSGKSTFLKKMANTQYFLGGKVRCFDASGEFSFLVKKANAKMINLNNPENIINPLQIYKSDYSVFEDIDKINNVDEDIIYTEEQIQEKFYQNHLSKFGIFFFILCT